MSAETKEDLAELRGKVTRSDKKMVPAGLLVTVDMPEHSLHHRFRSHRYDIMNPVFGPKLRELVDSVKERMGVQEECKARACKKAPGRWEVGRGNRRTISTRIANEELKAEGKLQGDAELMVPVVTEAMNDEEFLKLYVGSNYGRLDNDPLTEAYAMKDCREQGWSDELIAKEFQKKVGVVRRWIGPNGLLNGSVKVQQALANGTLKVGEALQITYLPTAREQDAALDEVLGGGQKHTSQPGEKNLTVETRRILLDLLKKVEARGLLPELMEGVSPSHLKIIRKRLCATLSNTDRGKYLEDDE